MKKLALGLSTLAATMAISATAFAQAAPRLDTVGGTENHSLIAIGAGIALGAAAFGSAFGQGRAASAALEGIARNPAAAGKIQVPMILALAFMEALTIFSWLVASGMSSKL